LVNRLNQEWVVAARRMSPHLLRELLAWIGPEVEAYFPSLDLEAIGSPKGVDPETAQASALVRGDAALASSIFRTVSVIG
jgi:hypothetical protein